jgi:hypothetical protein
MTRKKQPYNKHGAALHSWCMNAGQLIPEREYTTEKNK